VNDATLAAVLLARPTAGSAPMQYGRAPNGSDGGGAGPPGLEDDRSRHGGKSSTVGAISSLNVFCRKTVSPKSALRLRRIWHAISKVATILKA
jgi:hypothetical protein